MNSIMELTIALALSILGSVISVSGFVLSRKDKSNKDIKEEKNAKQPVVKECWLGGIKCLMR